jgi:DNA-binding MarR family transcriptional regulator
MAVNRVTTSKRAKAPAPRDVSRDDIREVLWLLADVVTGLKRSGGHEIPEECRTPFESGSLGPRHVPVLMTVTFIGELSVSQIAERIGLSLATTSLMVGELAREGLVERTEDDRDRRRTIVRLHADYRGVMDAWAQERFAPVGRALGRLSPTAHRHFLEGLHALADESRTHADHTAP